MKNLVLTTVCLASLCAIPCHAQESGDGVQKEISTPKITRPMGTLIRPENSPQHQELNEAWARYDAAVLKTAQAITNAIVNQFNASTQKGDLNAAIKWQAALDDYKQIGTVPSDPKTYYMFNLIMTDFKKAGNDLINSYTPLIKSLTIKKDLKAAVAAQAESEQLKQEANDVLVGNTWPANRIKKPKCVIVDRHRGDSRGVDDIKVFKHYGWRVIELDSPITEDILKKCALYYVRHGSNNPIYTQKELEILFKEYNNGGICMLIDAMTWVWCAYEKQTVDALPGNQLGTILGFQAPNAGSDAFASNNVAYDGLLRGVKFDHNKDEWYINVIDPIKTSKSKFSVLASDKNNGKPLIAQIDSGFSTTVIIGHCGFFVDYNRGEIPKKILSHFELKMGLR